ncbi:type VI secretion system lysozyme [Burkholderia cepacia]|uniref:type VI secretion system baseplate subunit TssE n=1 Tax=Burkholderia cepacia TaxID=292 RepID=UPI00075BEA1D|nr:type VI secretion system baseplate subunit TssE [Burkholderia cepacia]KVA46780.1 type VI secretion system lysozyme [Burkholderia cepacia]KVA51579.1 type VI secretion system lysozyme [Burkholderia cepacia]KVA70843.1 type VI secretion system lysozyme [Burkholderia cepacia]KVA78903.1 type VI secretion system lysozyme [Burkholderia cepacia]KVA78925.1 type VI secretion system lysozyme [Burkholderia cepacia]
MAELVSKHRLQPALLDRLTDREPDQRSESRERRVVSMRQLRESVLRDLVSLFNAMGRYSRNDLADYPFVECSVLNYGLPTMTGKTLSDLNVSDTANQIAEAIRRFEPRISSYSVRVTPLPTQVGGHRNTIAFLIEGELWAQPYPERLYFKTELDLEGGEVFVSEHGDGRVQ